MIYDIVERPLHTIEAHGALTPKKINLNRPNIDGRGNIPLGRNYNLTKNKGEDVNIRDDAAGHNFDDNSSQDRGSHFNDPDENHYEY